MALSILDGNQSATTLSTILSSGQHITAHTVVSLGTQAITDMRGAVSGSVVSISNFPTTQTIAGTVTANVTVIDNINNVPISLKATDDGFLISVIEQIPSISGTVTAKLSQNIVEGDQRFISVVGESFGDAGVHIAFENENDGVKIVGIGSGRAPLPISGTVTANLGGYSQTAVSISGSSVTAIPVALQTNGIYGGTLLAYNGANTYLRVGLDSVGGNSLAFGGSVPISGTVTVGNTVTIAGTVTANPTGTQTIAGSVTIGAGTAQIGSVTASISNSVTIASFATSVTARLINPAGTAVTYAEVGTAGNPSIDVLSVQGVTSGTPLTILNHQGTTVTTSNFTSTTASTTLASANTSREVLTIFNEGAGNLHICAGATCTTIAYQVRLSAGDYYEVPLNQTSLTHSAVFATAGTARIVQIS